MKMGTSPHAPFGRITIRARNVGLSLRILWTVLIVHTLENGREFVIP